MKKPPQGHKERKLTVLEEIRKNSKGLTDKEKRIRMVKFQKRVKDYFKHERRTGADRRVNKGPCLIISYSGQDLKDIAYKGAERRKQAGRVYTKISGHKSFMCKQCGSVVVGDEH